MAVPTPAMDPTWLKEELEKPGRSQSDLARYLGLEHPSIVNRMCKGDRAIKAWEADKIREYLALRQPLGAATNHIGERPSLAAGLPVRGTVEAGSWREVAYQEAFEPEYLPAPQSIVDSGAFALLLQGPSMDLHYAPGTYLVVTPWYGGPPPIGKHVVVKRERAGMVETTVKELVRDPSGGLELWPKSRHPSHQTPVRYDADEEDALVQIIGVVSWAISPVP